MNYLQYMKPGDKFWALPNGQEDISWSEFQDNWKQAIEKAKDQIIDKWENLKQDYKDAANPTVASERKQAESIEATRAKQASMKFVSDNRTDYEKKRDRKNLELKEFEQKQQQNKEATDAVMWTLTGIPYAVQHLASPDGLVKTVGNTRAAIQNGGGPYLEKAVASAAGDVLDATIVGVPVWNAARPYAVGLYNTTNYSSLGNRLAHPIESLRFAKINTKLSDLVRQAYPEETAKLMLEEASPLFKTVRYYNKGTSGPQYIGGTDIPLQIEGLRNTPTTTVKMWDRAHEYGHLFDDALRRLDTGMARGSFGLSKEGISLVPKSYTYSPNVGINTPRGQMEFVADNIASSLYPEPQYVGMLHGEVAPYLERQALAAQVPFSSMYVQNGSTHVPYFLPEYQNFGRFIPTSTRRGNLGKGYQPNTSEVLSSAGTRGAKISEAERLGIPKGDRGNLSESQQEAVRDLHHYITDGKFKQRFLFDAETNQFFWGNAKPTPSTNAITTIAQHPQATIRLYDDGIGYMRIPTQYGTLTYFPHLKTTSHTISFPKSKINPQGFGEAAARAENQFGKSVILTSPKTDAIDAGVVVEGLSSTVPKQQVYDFYKQLALTSKPSTYVTGDAAAYPLGHQAIMDYVGGNSTKAVSTILSGETPIVTAASRTGLSPDSYISLLRSAQRPEWKLSFNRKQGFGKWNNSAVNNSDIYNAWQAARNGTLEQKQAYIQLFNDWVAPYGGAKAYINDKGIIIHPHPFIVRQKQGGTIKIKKKNRGKFTASAKAAGHGVQEHAHKVMNDPNATPLQKKRANFAIQAKKWHRKHQLGGKLNYLNLFK